ncbi:class I glutamine amidotransferase-like protein [Clohesyomyces aquaticus]|uniref:Class I glutamine amidotransferase-like protein n=1 Tax=Clohesyomyces aquaticus TaxID=1231657 RepID=A0A1Y1YUV3_9PLEO|nr:class I glutamine amidotransferase-like protein [Clohesyomyces aquaticus]
MSVQVIRIAMLNTDVPVPNVCSKLGSYGDIFHNLLSAAACRISAGVHIESTNFDVVAGEYPSIQDHDVLLITGSASSAYDDIEWIRRLDDYILDVYTHNPRVRIFGSCFGHQLVCQSLLRTHCVRVEKDPNGWELGVQEIQLTENFWKRLGSPPEGTTSPLDRKLRLQFVHADHVILPTPGLLPESWMTMGSTQHCAVQGVYQPGRVLTFQGHFEFDRFVNTETLRVFGAAWEPEKLKDALMAIDADDDSKLAAEIVVRFLTEKGEGRGDVPRGAGGLLTPPLEE